VIYLTLPELLHVAERTLGAGYAVRDYGLLEDALARPRATAFGKDAYPDLDAKARRRCTPLPATTPSSTATSGWRSPRSSRSTA
jgi:hypothetical protein